MRRRSVTFLMTCAVAVASCTSLYGVEPDPPLPAPPADAGGPTEASAGGNGAVEVLASGQDNPSSLVLADDRVVWANEAENGAIVSVRVSAPGQPLVLAAGQSTPVALAVAPGNIFWATPNAVLRVPLSGGAPVVVKDGRNGISSVAVSGTVYWTLGDTVEYCNEGGSCCGCYLTNGQPEPRALDIRSGRLRWLTSRAGGAVESRKPAGSGEPPRVDAFVNGATRAFAMDGTTAYVTTNDSIRRATVDDEADGGAPSEIIAEGLPLPWGIAIDSSSIWITCVTDGTVRRIPKAGGAGGAGTVFARGLAGPKGIAVDGAFVYVASSADGRIVRIAK